MRILRDDSEAEDLLQDVFLFVHRNCTIFDSSKAAVRSWIVQITYHRAIDRRRYLNSRHFYTRHAAGPGWHRGSTGSTLGDQGRWRSRGFDHTRTSGRPNRRPAQYFAPAFL